MAPYWWPYDWNTWNLLTFGIFFFWFVQDEAAAALLAATATPKHHHITEDDEELTNGNHSGDVSRDLDIDENIKDPVEDRKTLAERSERLHGQLMVRFYSFFSLFSML